MESMYYTWRKKAENTMEVNNYHVRHEYQSKHHVIQLFENRTQNRLAILKSWKSVVYNSTRVMIFADKKEAERTFREMVEDEMLVLY